ncbi:reverse transcriptase [Gossypium australe]|uniref:Reverse transcriptase n=1 Tax=Gossypium australe TaxID=47621 RepID=A0A5B6UY94_9ROSI|nr:reverse transcriptase [Gossypium australe]
MGGIGFRDLHLFNLALLGRQVWRLMTQKDTLCFKVLSTKYFPKGDVFRYKRCDKPSSVKHQILPERYKRCDKPSFTWTSIAKAVDALKDGFIWQVGDGDTIDIRRDHWGVEGIKGESACRSTFTNDERKVKDLWEHNVRRWKRERVIEIYGKRTWIQNPHGFYTSKPAYSWLILKKVGFGPHRFLWRAIWKLKMLPKIKIFSWRINHNIFPTFDNVARIRQGFNNICPRKTIEKKR